MRSPRAARDERTGELAAAAVQGVDALEAYFAGYLPQLVLAAAVPVAILAWVVPLDLAAAVVFAVTIPLLIVFMILVGKGAQSRRALALAARSRCSAGTSSTSCAASRRCAPIAARRRRRTRSRRSASATARRRWATLRVAFLSALVLELCAMIGTALVAATIGIQLDGGRLACRPG